jgi:coenzyme F420-reducing hydrogenase alpha subunit
MRRSRFDDLRHGAEQPSDEKAVAQIARHYIKGLAIPEPLLNRVEAGIRAFDPCLSCYGAWPCLTAPG